MPCYKTQLVSATENQASASHWSFFPGVKKLALVGSSQAKMRHFLALVSQSHRALMPACRQQKRLQLAKHWLCALYSDPLQKHVGNSQNPLLSMTKEHRGKRYI